MDFVSALPLLLMAGCLAMGTKYHDNYLAIAKACGFSNAMPSLWRHGKRQPSRAVRFILKLADLHGIEALLSGELAHSPSKPAQDSAQVPKPKRTRRKATK